jgi:hypothetical protein
MVVSLRTALFLQKSGTCPTQLDEVVRGWGQYKDSVALLPPTEKDKIPQIADIVVNSFLTPGCTPLGQIVIIGHADKDFHGADFELKVSKERATSVAAALVTAIIAAFKPHKIDHLAKGAIAFDPSPTGVGATQPDPDSAHDRTLNRRVEIHIRPRGAPIAPEDTLEARIRRALKLLDTKSFKIDSTGQRKVRARCLLNKMLRFDVVELFVDGTKKGGIRIGSQDIPFTNFTANWPGNYDGCPNATNPGPPLPQPEFMKLLGTVTPLLFPSSSWAPTLPDEDILDFLDTVVLEKIYAGILRVENYLATQVNLFTGIYSGDQARIRCNSLYSAHFDDENNIYNCWKGYTGGEDTHIL